MMGLEWDEEKNWANLLAIVTPLNDVPGNAKPIQTVQSSH